MIFGITCDNRVIYTTIPPNAAPPDSVLEGKEWESWATLARVKERVSRAVSFRADRTSSVRQSRSRRTSRNCWGRHKTVNMTGRMGESISGVAKGSLFRVVSCCFWNPIFHRNQVCECAFCYFFKKNYLSISFPQLCPLLNKNTRCCFWNGFTLHQGKVLGTRFLLSFCVCCVSCEPLFTLTCTQCFKSCALCNYVSGRDESDSRLSVCASVHESNVSNVLRFLLHRRYQ